MKLKKDTWKQMTVRIPPEVHRALGDTGKIAVCVLVFRQASKSGI